MPRGKSNRDAGVQHGNYRVPRAAVDAAKAIPPGKYDPVLLAAALLRAGWRAP